jgi:hypothetical protein
VELCDGPADFEFWHFVLVDQNTFEVG